jgi:cytosine deaminase
MGLLRAEFPSAFCGPEDYLRSRGVEVVVVNNRECRQLMKIFVKNNPELWHEDIGVESDLLY